MSNDKNNLVYREQLDDNVIEMLSEDIGNNYSLRTENTKTIVAALNEILGKDIICNAVGSPLLTTDTFNIMGEKIHVMVNEFKAKLMGLGVSVSSVDKLASLIEKIGEIDLGVDAEELLAPLEESLREILGDKGVELSGGETLAELIVKVDEEFNKAEENNIIKEQKLIDIMTDKNIDGINSYNDCLNLLSESFIIYPPFNAGVDYYFINENTMHSMSNYTSIDNAIGIVVPEGAYGKLRFSFKFGSVSGNNFGRYMLYVRHIREGNVTLLEKFVNQTGVNTYNYKNYDLDLKVGDIINIYTVLEQPPTDNTWAFYHSFGEFKLSCAIALK